MGRGEEGITVYLKLTATCTVSTARGREAAVTFASHTGYDVQIWLNLLKQLIFGMLGSQASFLQNLSHRASTSWRLGMAVVAGSRVVLHRTAAL